MDGYTDAGEHEVEGQSNISISNFCTLLPNLFLINMFIKSPLLKGKQISAITLQCS